MPLHSTAPKIMNILPQNIGDLMEILRKLSISQVPVLDASTAACGDPILHMGKVMWEIQRRQKINSHSANSDKACDLKNYICPF